MGTTAYWNGAKKAHLTKHQVRAAWGSGDWSLEAIGLCNRAFEIYYTSVQRINKITNRRHQDQMLKELTAAGNAGRNWKLWRILGNRNYWVNEPYDLASAFKHIVKNRGYWVSNKTWWYNGGKKKVHPYYVRFLPVSIVNYLNAVDKRMAILVQMAQELRKQMLDLISAEQSKRWEPIGMVLGQIKSGAERAAPFLWLAPNQQTRAEKTATFFNVLSSIQSGMTAFAQAKDAGFGNAASAAIGTMRAAMGWVPVLGDFYGAAIDMIPGLAKGFKALLKQRCDRIDELMRQQ